MNGISIIVPTLNRSKVLINTLKDLIKQIKEIPFEILVVDQSDVVDEEVISFCDNNEIIYFHITNFKGLPQARNFGAQHANYDWLLYLDDDIECNNDLLYHYSKAICFDSNIGLIAGGITEKFKDNIDCKIGYFDRVRCNPLRGFHLKGIQYVDHVGGGNFLIKKNVFFSVGGSDENLSLGAALYEELDLSLRVQREGHKILFYSNAHVFHLANPDGGCRVHNPDKYIFSLVRNRTIIISRYLNLIQTIFSIVYLFRLVFAYVLHYKKPSLLKIYFKAICSANNENLVLMSDYNNRLS